MSRARARVITIVTVTTGGGVTSSNACLTMSRAREGGWLHWITLEAFLVHSEGRESKGREEWGRKRGRKKGQRERERE